MAKPTGFLEFGRQTPTRRPVEERVHDWLNLEADEVGVTDEGL